MTVVSLFSGAGGLDLGLRQAGHKILWANDFDVSATHTYRENIGKHIVCSDIKDIDVQSIPSADVVIGGFPCQGFSQANLKRSIDDERNQLYKFFHKVITATQPKFFIAENVRGILSIGGGSAIKKIIADFSQSGYLLETHLINMADYGVPQNRYRVFIIGQHFAISSSFLFRFPKPTHGKAKGKKLHISIKNAIKHFPDPDSPNKIPNHVYSAYKLAFRNFTGHRVTNPDKPSPTILARGNGKGGVCAIPHYNRQRRLTIRESATIQTFPDDFIFHGTMNSCYRQIGNAVPVLFSKLLGIELARMEKEVLK